MRVENIVIGKPLVDLWHLLGENEDDKSFEEITAKESERFLPRLLVKHGFFRSTSEVRKNRPDLFKELNEPDFMEIKIGKKRLWVVIGESI